MGVVRLVTSRLSKVVQLERRTPLGFRRLDLLASGFLSDRAYLYPERPTRRRGYVSDYAIEFTLGRINRSEAKLRVNDKGIFAEQLTAAGLGTRAPKLYGTVDRGVVDLVVDPAVIETRGAVLKPRKGSQGRGVARVASVDEMRSRQRDGYLVQELVEQASYAAAIWPGALNTIRVLGVRDADGPFVGPAAHRFGAAGTGVVDNFSAGGFVARVWDGGILSPLAAKPTTRQRVIHDRHPDTGGQVTGTVVPCWPEAQQLVIDLMGAFPDLLHVGWDLAVTDHGPVVIEGNAGVANLNVFQAHGPVLADERLRRFYRSHGVVR